MTPPSGYRFFRVQAASCLCLLTLLGGCQSPPAAGPTPPKGPASKAAPLVEVARPTKPDSGQVREYVGTVESRTQVSLVPQIAGQLLEVNASVGDRVQRGQILAVVEDPELDARLSQAQASVAVAQAAVQTAMANARAASESVRSRQQAVQQADAAIAESEAAIAKARSDLQLAETTLGRTRELEARQLIASQELDQAVADAASAAADLALAQARLRSATSEKKEAELNVAAAREQAQAAEAQISSAQAQAEALIQAARAVAVRSDLSRLRSPIDGTVVSRQLDPGAYVSPGNQSVIMVLANPDDLRVAFDLSEADIGLVHAGQTVTIRFDALPNQPQTGIVAGLAGGLDPASRTVRVEVQLTADSGQIRPGMLGRLIVAGGGAESLLAIPLPAVVSDKGEKYVYIMDKEKTIHKRVIQVASFKGDSALVSAGLSPDDQVVVQGVNLVREGQPARTEGDKA
jgi:HlyD family secretion protein